MNYSTGSLNKQKNISIACAALFVASIALFWLTDLAVGSASVDRALAEVLTTTLFLLLIGAMFTNIYAVVKLKQEMRLAAIIFTVILIALVPYAYFALVFQL